MTFVAAPLTKGSASGDGVNPPGRRQEDDHNVVAFHATQNPISGPDVPGVRRITPIECERLQALPDNWTNHGPDSRRYAALGDAVTSSVAEWIGRRILAAA